MENMQKTWAKNMANMGKHGGKHGDTAFFRGVVAFRIAVWPIGTHLQTTAQNKSKASIAYGQWTQGIKDDPKFFPLAVWLQSPRNAERYKQAGINLYVGLWNGPTQQQLVELKRAQMPVVCSQNETGMTSSDADIIVAWMHGDAALHSDWVCSKIEHKSPHNRAQSK